MGGWSSVFGGGDPPPAPNYAGLANLTAQQQQELLNQQTNANRPTQNTPWGSSTWSNQNVFDQEGYDKALAEWNTASAGNPGTIDWNRYSQDNPDIAGSGMTPQQHYERYGKNEGRPVSYTQNGVSQPRRDDFTRQTWEQNVTLNPAEQALLDQQRRVQGGLGNTAEGLLGQAQNSLSNPLSTQGLPAWMNYNMDALQDVDPNAVRNGVGGQTRNVQAGGLTNNVQAGGLTNNVQAGNLANIDANGLRNWGSVPNGGNFNMSAAGNSRAIQDATYSLLSPQRQRERDSEVQRLKNQGLTEDSPAFQRAMQRLDEGDTDAQLKSLLAGTTEYGNVFNRAMGQNNQNFGQRVITSGMSDAQRQAQLGERSNIAGFNNQNQRTRFDQGMSNANLRNANQQIRFGQGMSNANLRNTNQNTRFTQGMSNAQLRNQAGNMRFGQNLQQQNLAAMLRSQQFGEQGAQAALNNTQRGAMLQERQAIRQSPLNDLRSLMGGPVSNPTFANFMGAGQGQAPDNVGAANMGYQAQMNAFNAQQAQQNNMMSGLFGLGGSALAGAGAAGGFGALISDRRLKFDIKKIGKTNGGHQLYSYQYKFAPGVTHVGVMADEVRHVPGAVISINGYDAVNYSRIE